MNRKNTLLIALLVVVGVVVAAAWGQMSSTDAYKAVSTPGSYQVIAGELASTNFELIYVLDNESRRLAVLKYDQSKRQLVPLAGRNLPKDFGSDQGGGYSMVAGQLSGSMGLLYVTDHGARRAIVYTIDAINNKIVPQPAIDLKALFSD